METNPNPNPNKGQYWVDKYTEELQLGIEALEFLVPHFEDYGGILPEDVGRAEFNKMQYIAHELAKLRFFVEYSDHVNWEKVLNK